MRRFIATLLVGAISFGTMVPPALARANEKRAHTVAIGATAAAAYLLAHKDTRGLGLAAAGGAAYAWKKHHDAVKQRHNARRYSTRYYRSSRATRYGPTRTYRRSARYYKAKNPNYKNGYYRNGRGSR